MFRKLSAIMMMLAFVVSISLVGTTQVQSEEGMDGKKVFTDNRCNQCHAVEEAGIESKMGSDKYPDLSSLSGDYEAETLKKFIKKEDKLNGKSHLMKFNGSDKELDAIVSWLLEMNKAE